MVLRRLQRKAKEQTLRQSIDLGSVLTKLNSHTQHNFEHRKRTVYRTVLERNLRIMKTVNGSFNGVCLILRWLDDCWLENLSDKLLDNAVLSWTFWVGRTKDTVFMDGWMRVR
jgi:hypothetical protein